MSSTSDWPGRAADALDRAIALDSSFTLAVEERLYVAMLARDHEATRRFAAILERSVTSGFADDMMLWAAAVTLGDSAAASRWRGRLDESSPINFAQKLSKIPLHSVRFGLPLMDARWANETLRQQGMGQGAAWLGELAVALAQGHFVDFRTATDAFGLWGGEALLFGQALMEAPYRSRALALSAELTATYPDVPAVLPGNWPPLRDCFVELLRVTRGDTSESGRAIRRLREFAALDSPPIPRGMWERLDFRVCPLLLETLLEERRAADGTGASRLDALDSLMRTGPILVYRDGWLTAPTPFANFTIARLREAQGDLAGALAAIRRRENYYYPAYLWTLPAFLRQEGRLAALAGDTVEALRAYDHYLTLRTNPDAPFQPQRDSVVAERTALASR